VTQFKTRYVLSEAANKKQLTRQVLGILQSRDPPARFVKQDSSNELWYELDRDHALKKTAQALRERAPELKKKVGLGLIEEVSKGANGNGNGNSSTSGKATSKSGTVGSLLSKTSLEVVAATQSQELLSHMGQHQQGIQPNIAHQSGAPLPSHHMTNVGVGGIVYPRSHTLHSRQSHAHSHAHVHGVVHGGLHGHPSHLQHPHPSLQQHGHNLLRPNFMTPGLNPNLHLLLNPHVARNGTGASIDMSSVSGPSASAETGDVDVDAIMNSGSMNKAVSIIGAAAGKDKASSSSSKTQAASGGGASSFTPNSQAVAQLQEMSKAAATINQPPQVKDLVLPFAFNYKTVSILSSIEPKVEEDDNGNDEKEKKVGNDEAGNKKKLSNMNAQDQETLTNVVTVASNSTNCDLTALYLIVRMSVKAFQSFGTTGSASSNANFSESTPIIPKPGDVLVDGIANPNHPGNLQLADFIQGYRPEYLIATSEQIKKDVQKQVHACIISNQGSMLRRQGPTKVPVDAEDNDNDDDSTNTNANGKRNKNKKNDDNWVRLTIPETYLVIRSLLDQACAYILNPSINDVLFDGDLRSKSSPGTVFFMEIVKKCKPMYITSAPEKRKQYAAEIVGFATSRPARFLGYIPHMGMWTPLSFEDAIQKTTEAIVGGKANAHVSVKTNLNVKCADSVNKGRGKKRESIIVAETLANTMTTAESETTDEMPMIQKSVSVGSHKKSKIDKESGSGSGSDSDSDSGNKKTDATIPQDETVSPNQSKVKEKDEKEKDKKGKATDKETVDELMQAASHAMRGPALRSSNGN